MPQSYQTDVSQVEGEVRWYVSLRCSESQVSGCREHKTEDAAGGAYSRYRHAEGCELKKVVTPDAKREAVSYLQTAYGFGERRTCAAMSVDRSTIR